MDSGVQAAPGRPLERSFKLLVARGDRLDGAERAGVEVSSDRLALQQAHDAFVEARLLVQSFDLERFLAAASAGIAVADAGVAAGRRAEAELRLRLTGLGFALVVILAVIVALALKVRAIEKEAKP